MASGSWTFNTGNPNVQGRVRWTSTSNGAAANTSNLFVEVHLRRISSPELTTFGTARTSIRFSLSGVNTSEGEQHISVNGTWVLARSTNRTISHTSNGSRTLNLRAVGTNPSITGFQYDTNRDITLVNIPRFATINSWLNTIRTANSATFSWSANADISRVVCRLGGANGTEWFNSGTLSAGTRNGTFTVSGLTENTTYNNVMITVTRRDSNLTTNSSNISFTTPFEAPTSNLSVGTTTINSIPLTWSSNFNCDAVWIYLNGVECLSQTNIDTSSGTINLLPTHGITHSTSYSIVAKVRRKDSQDIATSDAVTATTLRVPTIASNAPASFNIGTNITIPMENRNSPFSLTLERRTNSGEWVSVTTSASTTNANATITRNTTIDNVLYGETVNSNTLPCRIVVRTTMNNVTYSAYVGGIHHLTANVVNSNPTFGSDTDPRFTLNANREDTAGINNRINNSDTVHNMISGEGGMQLRIVANSGTARNSATLTNWLYRVSLNNSNVATGAIPYEATARNFDIPNANTLFRTPGDYTVFLSVVDSRGNLSVERSRTFTVFQYSRPVINATITRYKDFESWTSLSLSATISRLTISGVQQNIIARISHRHAEVGDAFPGFTNLTSGWTTTNGTSDDLRASINVTANATSGWINLPSDRSFNFQFTITDGLFTSTIFATTVSQGMPLFSVFENGKTAVNVVPNLNDNAPALQVGGDISFAHSNGRNVLASRLTPDSGATNAEMANQVTHTVAASEARSFIDNLPQHMYGSIVVNVLPGTIPTGIRIHNRRGAGTLTVQAVNTSGTAQNLSSSHQTPIITVHRNSNSRIVVRGFTCTSTTGNSVAMENNSCDIEIRNVASTGGIPTDEANIGMSARRGAGTVWFRDCLVSNKNVAFRFGSDGVARGRVSGTEANTLAGVNNTNFIQALAGSTVHVTSNFWFLTSFGGMVSALGNPFSLPPPEPDGTGGAVGARIIDHNGREVRPVPPAATTITLTPAQVRPFLTRLCNVGNLNSHITINVTPGTIADTWTIERLRGVCVLIIRAVNASGTVLASNNNHGTHMVTRLSMTDNAISRIEVHGFRFTASNTSCIGMVDNKTHLLVTSCNSTSGNITQASNRFLNADRSGIISITNCTVSNKREAFRVFGNTEVTTESIAGTGNDVLYQIESTARVRERNGVRPAHVTMANIITGGTFDRFGQPTPDELMPMSGSNENGSWVRYPDGTQICTILRRTPSMTIDIAAGTGFRGASITWTYPMPFIDGIVNVSVGQARWNPDSATILLTWGVVLRVHLDRAVFYPMSLTSRASQPIEYTATAIGRWK